MRVPSILANSHSGHSRQYLTKPIILKAVIHRSCEQSTNEKSNNRSDRGEGGRSNKQIDYRHRQNINRYLPIAKHVTALESRRGFWYLRNNGVTYWVKYRKNGTERITNQMSANSEVQGRLPCMFHYACMYYCRTHLYLEKITVSYYGE
jgi:hypothetical protein